jgi:hypothetical protein
VAITSYPFENGDTSESQFSRLFVELQDSGVAASSGSNALQVTANGTDLTLSIAAGFAVVRGHALDSSATETRTLAAAESNPRIDRVILRLDPVSNLITPEVLRGSPSVSPQPQGLVQTETGIYEMLLADVNVPAAALAISPTDVVDKRTYVGGRVGAWTTSTRPTAPRKGTSLGLNVTTGLYEFWDGSAWKTLVDPTKFLAADGKAVDSDKLDGIDSTGFLKTDETTRVRKSGDSMTGKLTVDLDTSGTGWGSAGLEIQDTNMPRIAFHQPGAVASQIGQEDNSEAIRTYDNAGTGYAPFKAAAIYDGGQRVYSPNNPPPETGMKVLGDGAISGSTAKYAANTWSDVIGVNFVAPPSGRVMVHVGYNNRGTYTHYVGARVSNAAQVQGKSLSTNDRPQSRGFGFSGLTAGASYTAYLTIYCSSATDDVSDPSIYVMG